MWICPKCSNPLISENSTWKCLNNHHFDIAKEGYVNLLLANQKRTRDPGDNRDMINARRAFLEKDHYLPLAEKLASLIQSNTSTSGEIKLHDIGCGEGYYLDCVRRMFQQQDIKLVANGSDIAKNAIQKASKKYKECNFAVASNAQLPLASTQTDALLQVFAPVNEKEVFRVLSNSGIWLQVSPGPEHLKELKKHIYSTPEEHQENKVDIDGFKLQHHETLSYKVRLDEPADRKHLLMMTPFYWSTEINKIDIIINKLNGVTICFNLKLYSKDEQFNSVT